MAKCQTLPSPGWTGFYELTVQGWQAEQSGGWPDMIPLDSTFDMVLPGGLGANLCTPRRGWWLKSPKDPNSLPGESRASCLRTRLKKVMAGGPDPWDPSAGG